MSGNKRVRGTKPKSGLKAVDSPTLDPAAALRSRERALKKKVVRMRVEMVAGRLGFPIGKHLNMSLAQAAAKRRRFLVQLGEFLVTAILFCGACAWLYQWWLTRQ